MKNLRELFSIGWLGTNSRQTRETRARRRDKSRRLQSESLEKRQLLASDIALAHNYLISEDTDQNNQITAADALAVINFLNMNGSGQRITDGSQISSMVDVNADHVVTAGDALAVINKLNLGEGVGELVELFLNPIKNGGPHPNGASGSVNTLLLDQATSSTPQNRVFNVNVDEIFFLELSYNDLRQGSNQLGAFQISSDISLSSAGALVPVLTELQTIRFSNAFNQPGQTGTFTFSLSGPIPGTTQTTAPSTTIDRALFFDAPVRELTTALQRLGYSRSQFRVSNLTAATRDGDPPAEPVLQISYIDLNLGDLDLPNPVVSGTSDGASATVTPVPPRVGGAINGAALPSSLDTRSRTFVDKATPDISNGEYYNQRRFGAYDPAATVDAFNEVGVLGRVAAGGVPSEADLGDFIEPFDAFAIPVRFTRAVSNFVISLNPAENDEAILLYPGGTGTKLTQDQVLVNATSTFTINAIGGNTAPVVSGPVTFTANENAAAASVNLLANATDAEGDTLSVTGLQRTSGDDRGVVVNGNSLQVTPSAYASILNQGDTATIVYSYQVTDGTTPVSTTATITINGLNDTTVNRPPVNNAALTATFPETAADAVVDLLANTTDPDNDPLNVVAGSITRVSGDDRGIVVSGNNLQVSPGAYAQILNDGQNAVITYTYQISDGRANGTITQTATVTINGSNAVNQNPVVSAPVSATFAETAAATSVSLLTGTTDPDSDPLNVTASSFTVVSGNAGGITRNGNSLQVTPSFYNSLNQGQQEVVRFSYQINDGRGGTAAQTATITITGVNSVNQSPVVSGPVTATFAETAAATSVNLLTNASDPDGDTLNVSSGSLAVVSGNAGGITQSGNSLQVNPGFYSSLNDGQSEVVRYSYTINDGNGGTVPQTATITITGVTDVPVNRPPVVSGPVVRAFSENDATANVSLLTNASDPDSDTLSVTGVTLSSGDARGVSISGNSLVVDPGAYSALVAGQNAAVVYTYSVIDGRGGTVQQTATVTINGFNNPPVANPDNNLQAFAGSTTRLNVLGNDNAGGDETQSLTVTAASVTSGNATIAPTADGLAVSITPNAGFTGTVTFNYTVRDAGGATSQGTGSVNVQNFAPSVISGAVFFDSISNLSSVLNGGAIPIRDGVQSAGERGLGGAAVRLTSPAGSNATGQAVNLTVFTELDGGFEFTNVPPGTYQIVYDIPSNVIFGRDIAGAAGDDGNNNGRMSVTIANGASVNLAGMNFTLYGTRDNSIDTLDILSSVLVSASTQAAQSGNGGLQGGLVSFDASGNQAFVRIGDGFDGVRYVEVAMNAARDAALLTVVEANGSVKTARLNRDQFVVSTDGRAVQFIGGMEDFSFVNSDTDLVNAEFQTFRDAIDRYLGTI